MQERFKEYIKGKYPNLDTDRILSIIDKNVKEVKPNSENHDGIVRVPIGCDLNKNLIIQIISEYLSPEQI